MTICSINTSTAFEILHAVLLGRLMLSRTLAGWYYRRLARAFLGLKLMNNDEKPNCPILPFEKSRISDLIRRGTHNVARGARQTHTTTRAVHAARAAMVAAASRKRKRDLDSQAGVAIPGLPFDVAVSLVEKHLPDPADLAVLRAVSRGMRAAVDATGRKVQEFGEEDAVERGYVSTLKCLRRRGRLSDERLLCAAAARVGDLDALKALRRAEKFPWDERTCMFAARGGHLEVLKWARENGCPWNEFTCASAAKGGHLDVLKWARANGCPWNWLTCVFAAKRGHIELLRWARENGAPWSSETRRIAASKGYYEPPT